MCTVFTHTRCVWEEGDWLEILFLCTVNLLVDCYHAWVIIVVCYCVFSCPVLHFEVDMQTRQGHLFSPCVTQRDLTEASEFEFETRPKIKNKNIYNCDPLLGTLHNQGEGLLGQSSQTVQNHSESYTARKTSSLIPGCRKSPLTVTWGQMLSRLLVLCHFSVSIYTSRIN